MGNEVSSDNSNSNSDKTSNSNENNGLITKIWGAPTWDSGHAITFGYPIKPTFEQKLKYRIYFETLGDVLPCVYCRDSYKKFITEDDTKLTDEVLKNRENLTKWFYLLHEKVNKKLCITYHVRYQDVVEKYESYRAKCTDKNKNGCVVPLDYKKISYKNYYNKDCVIIPVLTAKKFVPIAKKVIRGFKNEDNIDRLIDFCDSLNEDYQEIKKTKIWFERNIICNKITKHMRLNGINSKNEDGTLSYHELMLVMLLCCSCSTFDLEETYKEKYHNIIDQS
jgi:hypothetical protein